MGIIVALLLGAITLYLLVWLFYYCSTPKLLYNERKATEAPKMYKALSQCTSLHKPYIPCPFLLGGNLMSLTAAGKRKKPNLKFTRELFAISDGGQAAVDWAPGTEKLPSTAPVFLLLHGMNGGSNEGYSRWIMLNAVAKGYRAGVLISRGCCGLRLTTWRLYNAGWTEDLREVSKTLKQRYPESRFFVAGVSLGGNILANYLGEEKEGSPFTAAVSISNPIDLVESAKQMRYTFEGRYIYSPYITVGLKRLIAKNKDMMATGPFKIDFEGISRVKQNWDFDEIGSCKFFGFEHAEDYYKNFESKRNLSGIRTPTLFITAKDDPMLGDAPINAFVKVAKENPNIAMAVTRTGGHYGFFEVRDMLSPSSYINYFKESWAERVMMEFFAAASNDKDE